ncbi:hypothetical protein LINPERPRIM_LOCUS16443 [Linum perenne]
MFLDQSSPDPCFQPSRNTGGVLLPAKQLVGTEVKATNPCILRCHCWEGNRFLLPSFSLSQLYALSCGVYCEGTKQRQNSCCGRVLITTRRLERRTGHGYIVERGRYLLASSVV